MTEFSDSAQKMMAAMGWKKGESLGKHQQGVNSYVKVQKRQEGLGLGLDRSEQHNKILLAKGSGKASFDDPGSPWWSDAFSAALAKANGGEKNPDSGSLDDIYKATGGARLGMRARLYQGAKLRRTEQSEMSLSKKNDEISSTKKKEEKKKKKKRSSSPNEDRSGSSKEVVKKRKKSSSSKNTIQTS